MADFEIADKRTRKVEGGWANNPADSGGETYKGIARAYHPKWPGWAIIDRVKGAMVAQPTFGTGAYYSWVGHLNKTLEGYPQLQSAVVAFYRSTFWGRLGEIASQELANLVYDLDVNTGSRGSKWLQECVGAVADGQVGPKTLKLVAAADPQDLIAGVKKRATAHYLSRAAHPGQKQFLHSWLARIGHTEAEIAALSAAVAVA